MSGAFTISTGLTGTVKNGANLGIMQAANKGMVGLAG